MMAKTYHTPLGDETSLPNPESVFETSIWLVILTDNLELVAGKKFLGFAVGEENAKKFAQEVMPAYLVDYSVTELDGKWCIQGREPESNSVSFIGIYRVVIQ